MTEVSSFKVVNIEQQNKKPQNGEVITSIFKIPCSILCGSNRSSSDEVDSDCFSPEFWILTPDSLVLNPQSQIAPRSMLKQKKAGIIPL